MGNLEGENEAIAVTLTREQWRYVETYVGEKAAQIMIAAQKAGRHMDADEVAGVRYVVEITKQICKTARIDPASLPIVIKFTGASA